MSTEQRQARVAEALWRVIRRDGLAAASVRSVAREADLSAGSLRHLFPSQTELFAFAMRLVIQRITAHVGRPSPPETVEHAEQLLGKFLPLDDESTAESEVWLAFTARSLVDEELHSLRDEGYDVLRSVCEAVVLGLSPDEADTDGVAVETDRLYAVVDGLLIHRLMRPDRLSPTQVAAVLRHHLTGVARSPGQEHNQLQRKETP